MIVIVPPDTEYSSRLTGRQRTGLLSETIAAEFARTRTWENIDRNVRVPSGEIDLVVPDDCVLVLLEVRTRRSASRDGLGKPYGRETSKNGRVRVRVFGPHRDASGSSIMAG